MAYTRCVSVVSALLAPALLSPGLAQSESAIAWNGHSASARVNIRVVVPPVANLLQNQHPRELAPADGEARAEQRLVVMSNLPRGFCLALRQTAPQAGAWSLETAPQSGIRLDATAEGYRLCSTRAGQYTVLLQHRFGGMDSGQNTVHWPVQTEISAL